MIGRNCLIGAKALIAEGKQIPDNSLVMGMPGKIVGEVRPEQAERIRRGTARYVANWRRYGPGSRRRTEWLSRRSAITGRWSE